MSYAWQYPPPGFPPPGPPPFPPYAEIPPPPPARPATVTVAGWLVWGVIGVLLAEIVLGVASAVHFAGEIDRAAALTDPAPSEVSDERVGNIMGLLFTGVPALVFAIWLAICVPPLLRGRNAARILTIVPAGLMLLACCVPAVFGLALGAFLFSGPMTDEPSASGPWPESEPGVDPDFPVGPDFPVDPDYPQFEDSEFYDRLYLDSDPVWDLLGMGTPLLALLSFGLAVAVAVLLLTPSANRFFRPPHPPAFWPGYPYPVPMFAPPGYPHQPPPIAPTGYPQQPPPMAPDGSGEVGKEPTA
ncbi:hypothetical protein [Micromonospora sp. NBC_01796]|uniref:hypothetical protein n=1 Tax=Micromonospora sp. NBC_01796 TaxID=2975987 RepID=UPI002DDBA170|nr:hypothetical protein [Micromonospora sp. NBC_01796]WSA88705.1 hypothetical protein OIE47_14485 [Micromonospora sp. NBC_01796]